MAQSISITAYSTALFSTWIFVEQYSILFDCGDGVVSSLLQKSRKIKHVFITHPDRDHITGLFQFNQLNGRDGLTVHYPKDSGSFPAIADFTAKFDPHTSGTTWNPISAGDSIAVRNDLQVRAIRNQHVPADPSVMKSLSFAVQNEKRKLRPEFAGSAGQRIAELRKEIGDEKLFETATDIDLIYSGDTPIENDGRYANARVLIHEATFLTREEIEPDNPKRNKHSSLDAVMEMAADSNIQNLILSHFSSRYSNEQIDEAIAKEKQRCGIDIPVFVIYPGQVSRFEI